MFAHIKMQINAKLVLNKTWKLLGMLCCVGLGIGGNSGGWLDIVLTLTFIYLGG